MVFSADYRETGFAECVAAGHGTITAANDQAVNTDIVHHADGFALTFGSLHFSTAGRPENRAAAMQNVGNIPFAEQFKFTVDQATVTVFDTVHLQTFCRARADNTADNCIHTGRITA